MSNLREAAERLLRASNAGYDAICRARKDPTLWPVFAGVFAERQEAANALEQILNGPDRLSTILEKLDGAIQGEARDTAAEFFEHYLRGHEAGDRGDYEYIRTALRQLMHEAAIAAESELFPAPDPTETEWPGH